MRKSEVVRPGASAAVRCLLLLTIATIVGIAGPTAVFGQQATTALPQPSTPSFQATSIPSTTVDYAAREYAGSQIDAVQPVALHSQLGRTAVQSQVAAPTQFPEYIRVGRTSNPHACVAPPRNVQRVDVVPFREYVKNVLPYEWYDFWPEASLDAGAIAVAQYAIVTIQQGKWSYYGHDFDVLDSTCDQVYLDRSSARNYARTDAAVDRMWGITLTRNGRLFPTYYRSHAALCGANCMGQRESRDLANAGLSGIEILERFYGSFEVNGWSGAVTTPAPAEVAVAAAPTAPASPPVPAATEYINVGRTFDPFNCVAYPSNVQRVDRIPLRDYVRNVLPYVTNANAPEATLDAAAVAVSQYAQATKAARKWTGFGYQFDVLDSTCDYAYFDRGSAGNYARTDAAVERMAGVIPY